MKREKQPLIIGTVYGIESIIIERAIEVSPEFSAVHIQKKRGLGGPNDILYILADPEFWESAVPWALSVIGAGIGGAIGKQIWEKYFPNRETKKIEELSVAQRQIGENLLSLMKTIQSIERYQQAESEVRLGFPTSEREERYDAGFVVQNPEKDLPVAILVNAAASERIFEIANNFQRDKLVFDYMNLRILDGTIQLDYRSRPSIVGKINETLPTKSDQ